MNYLLDTHALLWFIEGDVSLPATTREEIKNLGRGFPQRSLPALRTPGRTAMVGMPTRVTANPDIW